MADALDELIAQKLGQFPPAQPLPQGQPPQQAPQAAPPPPAGMAQLPPFTKAPKLVESYEMGPNGEKIKVMRPVGQMGGVVGPQYTSADTKEKPSYGELKTEVTNVSKNLLNGLAHNPQVAGADSWAVDHFNRTRKWSGLANKLKGLPQGLQNEIAAWGGPVGDPDEAWDDYFSKVGQIKAKLISVLSSGRQSIWMTKFLGSHLPSEEQMPAENVHRIKGLLQGGYLDRAIKEKQYETEGQKHITPEETAAMQHYEAQGMSPEEAHSQIVYDRILHGDKANGTVVGGTIE